MGKMILRLLGSFFVYIQSNLFFKIYIRREKKSKNYVYILTKIDQSDIIVFVKIKEIIDLTFN